MLAAANLLLVINPCLANDSDPTDCTEQTGHVHGAEEPLPELKGLWQLSDGGDIKFDVLPARKPGGSGQTVMAYFADDGMSGSCPFGAVRGVFVDAAFNGRRIEGTMNRCTNTEVLITKCHLEPTYKVPFYTTSVTKDTITGCRQSEHFATKENAACPYTRDPSGDHYVSFTVTRKESSPCPDATEVKHMTEVIERAAAFVRIAMKVVGDSQVKEAMETSEGALDRVAGGLGRVVALGEKCEALHDAMSDLRRFMAAIDKVNTASCGQQLAAGFDALFTSAGDVGERFGSIEGLGPVFEILAANETFFQDVSGALNPEHRWANQFAGIEGYTSTCLGS